MGLKLWFSGYRYLGSINLAMESLEKAETLAFDEIAHYVARHNKSAYKPLMKEVRNYGGIKRCICKYKSIEDEWGDTVFVSLSVYGHVANKRGS